MLTYSMEKRGGTPKADYLYACIRADIFSGALRSGEKLPSKRTLAEHLGLSVVTVETALARLAEEGYVCARERSGVFVNALELPAAGRQTGAAPAPLPPEEGTAACGTEFRFSALSKIMRQVITEYQEKLLQKPPRFGTPELRNAISGFLLRYRGMVAPPQRIVIGSGAEYLYGLLVQLFGRDRLYGLEDPSYEKIRLVYEANGAACELLELDECGVASASLAAARADVLHVTPFHSYPTGVTATAAKRWEYLAWAKRRGGYLIEDDFDSEFSLCRRPVETLYAMDQTGSVVYVNTFSKSLAPSMRMGYLVLPEGLMERYREKLGFYSCTVPAFDQYVLAEFIAQGHFERHLNRVRRALRQGEK